MMSGSEYVNGSAKWQNDVVVWEPGVVVNVAVTNGFKAVSEVETESGVSSPSPNLVDVKGSSEFDPGEEKGLGGACASEFWATRHAS